MPDVGGAVGRIGERPLDRVEVVCPDGHERAAAADVLMKLFLQVQEGIVPAARTNTLG